ncbi:FAD-binding oxidoreductase [Nocardia sp. NPDC024068]|uniref:FAD-binding oxidoreductase n=1 Tax=Nocardia sp. NPDC024068 TaxID=3157197 RepID=UPI0033F99C30
MTTWLSPSDECYRNELSTDNCSVVHHPRVVCPVASPADVADAVTFARERGLSVAVQSTGHGMSRAADGVLVTTRRLSRVTIDPVRRRAWVGAGARWREVITAAAEHGLAPLNGSSPHVGVMGYVLGGGVGMLGRQYGYAADHVHSIELVTADAVVRTISPATDPELFRVVRGGKDNFGIATGIEIDLFPVTGFYGGSLYFSAEHARELLNRYVRWTADLPNTLATSIFLLGYPDHPDIRPELRGRYIAQLRIAYFGPSGEAESLLAAIREVGPPVLDTVRPMRYTEIGMVHHEPVGRYTVHESGFYSGPLEEADVDSILAVAGTDAAEPLGFELRHHGGAYRKPPEVPNVVGGRDAEFTVYLSSAIDPRHDADRALHASARNRFRRLDRGSMLNFLGAHTDPAVVAAAFSAADLQLLHAVKNRVDPHNLFRVNHNIAPLTKG